MRLRNAPTPTSARRTARTAADGVDAPQGPCAQHYAEIAGLRAKADRLRLDRAALQELVTEQQVKIRQLRLGPGAGAGPPSPPAAQRKRSQPPPAGGEASEASAGDAAATKRARRAVVLIERNGGDGAGLACVATPPRRPIGRPRRVGAGPAADAADTRFAEPHEPHEIGPALLNRRILDSTRARRFVSLVGSSPLALPTALARMAGRVPPLDSARLVELLLAHAHTETAQLMPSAQPLAEGGAAGGERSAVAAGLAALAGGLQPGLYEHEAAVALSVWAVALRCEQKTFYGDFMRCLAAQLVLRASGPVPAACSLARVFAALGFLAADIQRVRAMLCDLLMEAGDSPHALPVLANALAVWPAVLAAPPAADAEPASDGRLSFGLMVRVVQAVAAGIHDLYAEERDASEADALYAIMVARCGWQQPSEAEFADTLLVEAKDTLGRLSHDSADYPVVMAALNLLAPYVS
ncbi:hypothetical protein H4R19_003040 [Coemansia spiralis]|nr:hypothetical protein H4R19_003040 [Coemansia spiralis]